MRIRQLLLAIALAGTLAAAALVLLPQLRLAQQTAQESALKSLEQRIVEKIDEYQRLNGKPPEALTDLEVDYSRTDGADSEMLRCFKFEALSDGYRLTRERGCP